MIKLFRNGIPSLNYLKCKKLSIKDQFNMPQAIRVVLQVKGHLWKLYLFLKEDYLT